MSPVPLLAESSTAAACAAALPGEPEAYVALSTEELMAIARSGAELMRAATRHNALVAGELARRSARELGHAGLAQQQGFRTPEELVRAITGSTAREAGTAVRVGKVMGFTEEQPWLAPVAVAVTVGTLSVPAADAIRSGVGTPVGEVTAELLTDAVTQLVEEAAVLDADRLQRRARELRDEIDEAGIADREGALFAKRSLWFTKNSDGIARLHWVLDPESAAVCGDLFDRATSPRRGGPRFVSGDNEALAEQLVADSRTTDQLASDTFLELLRQGAAADSSQLLGSGGPVVHVLVTQETFRRGEGFGRLEGSQVPVAIATVQRHACSGGVQEIVFDADLRPLDVGREQRLFTRRQRRALAARDGGCMWPGCTCPPSWTEAHHAVPWAAGGGATDVDNGILLCRFHHLLLHNNGWEIVRDGGEFWLIPPRAVDSSQSPIAMPGKSLSLRDLQRDRIPRAG